MPDLVDAHATDIMAMADSDRLTVLVTGANGLVGRALCQDLLGRGHRVRAAVRDSDGVRLSDSLWAQVDDTDVRLVQAPDLADPNAQWPLAGVDVVVHTAARVHVMNPAPDEHERFLTVNRDGTTRLAQQCVEHQVKRLVFLSTIKVNGERTETGQAFTAHDLPNPTDPYAVSKLQAETALQAISRETALEVTVIRPPLVYGPGAKGNLGALASAVRQGWPLPIGGLNANRRSLVSLANLVDLIVCCVTHPRAAGAVFLVSDDDDLSTLRLAQLMAAACQVRLRTVYVPMGLLTAVARALGRGDMLRRLTESLQVDVRVTCQTLGWSPVQTVEQAMASVFGSCPTRDSRP